MTDDLRDSVEEGNVYEWPDGSEVRIQSMEEDEDGVVQVRVRDEHPESPDKPFRVTLDDVVEKLNEDLAEK